MSAPAPVPPPANASRHAWLTLGILMATTALNVADRNLLNILLQPVKEAFDATDTQMGLLVGTWFAVVHNVAVLFVGRLADRGDRRSLVAAGLFLWSGLTALSGAAQSYAQLLVARMGVSATESAGSAPVHSLLADAFPPHQRATALGLISIGGIVGIALGMAVGGVVAAAWGWRAAFLVFGAPGLALALVVRAVVREPARGAADGIAAGASAPPLRATAAYLFGSRTYVHVVLSAGFHAFASIGTASWYPAYLGRVHGLDLATTGVAYAVVGPLLSGIGAFVGGRLADRAGARDVRAYMRIPAWSAVLSVPSTLAFVLWPAGSTFALGDRELPVALLVLMPASFLGGMWNGPTLAAVLGIARPRMRALASGLTTGTYNLVGLGLGPLLVGALSDALAPTHGVASLRIALLVVALAHLWGSLHNALAARTLARALADARAGPGAA
ncbi:MAG: MFS transporter [Myxococcota bacterium]